VKVHELWRRQGEFDVYGLDACKETGRALVRRQLRAVSRRYPPEAAAVFEHAMNAELATAMTFTSDPDLTCAYSVQVAPDEGLVEHLRTTEIKRLADNAEHERQTQHLSRLEVMQGRWLAFLRQLDREPLGQLAARLAGDQGLADAIAQHTMQQQQITEDLRELCGTATEAYRDKDVFEFVMDTESAFRRLLQHIDADGTSHPNGTDSAVHD
jgi:hypothetical protein